jgi:hypothetical protein
MDATGVIAAIETNLVTNLVTNLRLFASWASIPATSSAPVQSCRPLDVGITERVGQTVTPHRAGLAYGVRRALVRRTVREEKVGRHFARGPLWHPGRPGWSEYLSQGHPTVSRYLKDTPTSPTNW